MIITGFTANAKLNDLNSLTGSLFIANQKRALGSKEK